MQAIKNATMFAAIAPNLLLERIYRRSRGVDQCRSKPFVIFGQGVILSKAEKEFKTFIEKQAFRLHGPFWD